MVPGPVESLKSGDAIKTYRYLRIGMIGAVVLLAVSIVIEHGKAHCLQTSISAYYYTPVRAIFVGSMMAVGFALIAYKGEHSLEDICLNFAGMLAPVVAVAPTTDVGRCWSVAPNPLPVQNGSLAPWVATNVDNNFYALLIAGAIGLLVAVLIAIRVNRGNRAPEERIESGTIWSLVVTGVALFIGWMLIRSWGDFNTRAHGFAALLMFVFLILAIIVKANDHLHEHERADNVNRDRDRVWFRIYATVAALMILGGVLISWTRIFKEHTVFALEAYEIAFFAFYWLVQTAENWKEKVVDAQPVAVASAGGP